MRLNGFGKYIDVDELWPNKNACSAFAPSFATTGNAAWRSVPQLECGKAHITTHLCPSPSGQVTSSCVGTVSQTTSLVASTGALTSVINPYPWRETNVGTFLPCCIRKQSAGVKTAWYCGLYIVCYPSTCFRDRHYIYTLTHKYWILKRHKYYIYTYAHISTKIHDLRRHMPHTYTCTHLHINRHTHVSSMQPPVKHSINLHCIELTMNF